MAKVEEPTDIEILKAQVARSATFRVRGYMRNAPLELCASDMLKAPAMHGYPKPGEKFVRPKVKFVAARESGDPLNAQ